MKYVNLFVPGRVSIIGELSDIVVDYKKLNDSILPGEVIAAGIEKGIYATAVLSDDFIFEFNNDIFRVKDMDLKILSETAKNNSFYSYVASVAYLIKTKYNTSGISIKVRHMTLPIQKGLSSSASVCVLVAKAFNALYNLKLEYNDIMEIAYQAERYALSMCGRLDQICAKGLGVSHIIFHEDRLEINSLNIKKELNFVIADLNGFKDTKKILSTLYSCFPFPKNKDEEAVKRTLCEDNKYLVNEAIKAIEAGNKRKLGMILSQAQQNLDNSCGKICAALEGPILHKMMADEYIKNNSYGSKGTGSNGDGSIVILAKNKTTQRKIIKYLTEEYKMNSFEFNVKKTSKVSTAIINTLNHQFDNNKILSLLETLDSLSFNKLFIIGTKKELEDYKKILNKEYLDSSFESLTNKEKEYQINLCRIYEKIDFIISNNKDNKNISKLIKEPTLYIPFFNKEKIIEVLKDYDENNIKSLQNNLNSINDNNEILVIE